MTTTTVSVGIEGHTEVSGPKRFVNSWEVDTHLIECLNKVVSWFDSQVSHSAEPIVHSLNSPVTILIEEVPVSSVIMSCCLQYPSIRYSYVH